MAESRIPLTATSRSMLLPIKKIHPNIDLRDLDQSNGKLFSEGEIASIKMDERWQQDGRYKKSETGYRYPIIVQGGKYYAVYRGKKTNQQLGEGSYGYVKLVQDLDSGQFYALKSQRLTGKENRVRREVQNLEMLKLSPLDANGKAVAYDWNQSAAEGSADTLVMKHFLMNLVHGDSLDKLIERENPLPLVIYLKIVIRLLQQAEILFSQHNMLHNDIKLENIIVDSELNVSLVDYAFSSTPSSTSSGSGYHRQKLVGSPYYMAPELIQQRINTDPTIIISALGILKGEASGLEAAIKSMLDSNKLTLSPAIMNYLADNFPQYAKHKAFERLQYKMLARWRQIGITQEESGEKFEPSSDTLVEYTEQTQIYSLGIVIAKLLGFDELIEIGNNLNADEKNKHIAFADLSLRQNLIELVTSLLADDPTQRPTHGLAIKQFEALFDALSQDDRQVRVGIVAVSDLYDRALDPDVSKDVLHKLLLELASYHEVYLLHVASSDDFDLIFMQHYLRRYDINARDCFIFGEKNPKNKMRLSEALMQKNPDFLYEVVDLSLEHRLFNPANPGAQGVEVVASGIHQAGLFAKPPATSASAATPKHQRSVCMIL